LTEGLIFTFNTKAKQTHFDGILDIFAQFLTPSANRISQRLPIFNCKGIFEIDETLKAHAAPF
jgi:hypothetical protein